MIYIYKVNRKVLEHFKKPTVGTFEQPKAFKMGSSIQHLPLDSIYPSLNLAVSIYRLICICSMRPLRTIAESNCPPVIKRCNWTSPN